MYYGNQHGKCAYVLKLHESQYDVGFDDQKDGSYAMVCDLFSGQIAGQLRATCPVGKFSREEHSVGQLMQNYSKHAAMNVATSAGHIVDHCYIDDEGEVQIELQVA